MDISLILDFLAKYLIEFMTFMLIVALTFRWLAYKSSKYDSIYFSTFTRNASINILKIAAIRSTDLYQSGNIIKFMPNLFATNAIFMISREKPC